jgi:hypothetical protein
MIIRKSAERRGGREEFSRGRKAELAVFAFSSVFGITQCHQQSHAEVPQIELSRYLREQPLGISEQINEPGNRHPMEGKLADCRGRKECIIPIYPGQILLNIKFDVATGGNLAVAFDRVTETGIVLQGRVDFHMDGPYFEYQRFEFGKGAKLMHTDIKIRFEKSTNGTYFVAVE